MSAREKIAYLRGLIEGQNISENVGLSKFHEALLGALDTIADEIDDLAESNEDLREYVEDLEDELLEYHSEMDHDYFGDDESGSCGCGCEDEEEEYEAVTCPSCKKDFFYRPDAYDEDEDLLCPHCGEPFKQKL